MIEGDLASGLVLYTHRSEAELRRRLKGRMSVASAPICSTLDDLLTLLEVDAVGSILFDDNVPRQEVAYVTRWAHIFKPAVKCVQGLDNYYRLFSDAEHGIFFDSAILTDTVNSA